jgi:hypothetical protein
MGWVSCGAPARLLLATMTLLLLAANRGAIFAGQPALRSRRPDCRKYRCLFSVPSTMRGSFESHDRRPLFPASAVRRPRDRVPESPTEVKHGLEKGQPVDGGPQLECVALAVAFVAVVSPRAHVDREDPTSRRCRSVHRTWAMQLVSTAAYGLKIQLPQDFLHADLGAQFVEVDAWHGVSRKTKT